MPTATFNTGLKVAIEESNNIAPGGSTNPHWWQGGRWIPITTDGLPSLQNRQAIIFPAGAAGNRNINARAPVQGRKWSDGGFSFPITQDFLGVLLYAALGTASTNEVPSTDATLASGAEIIDTLVSSIDLSSQPSDGGAILRFRVTQGSATTTDMAGYISVSGIDAEGNGASETITVASAGSFYTRNSYSAIGPSSITYELDSDGTIQVTGVKWWEHTFSPGPSNPTIAIERIGDPTAGAASKAWMHTSMVVTELTFNIPAAQRDGLMTGTVNFEGHPAGTCNQTSQMATSPMIVWPSWGLSMTRDNLVWNRVTNATVTIGAGNRNYRAAAGTQLPQGSFFGPREVTGSFDILVDNEEEYNRWLGASSHAMAWEMTTPHKLTSSQNQKMSASFLSSYLENVDIGDDDDIFSLAADFRSIEDSAAGVMSVLLINGLPGIAYGVNVD